MSVMSSLFSIYKMGVAMWKYLSIKDGSVLREDISGTPQKSGTVNVCFKRLTLRSKHLKLKKGMSMELHEINAIDKASLFAERNLKWRPE